MLLHNILGFQVMLCFYYRVFIQFFPMESMFVEQNFRCLYKPIGELFRFFSKWDDIYSVQCIISEIFSRIGDNLFSSSSSSSSSSWTRPDFQGRRSRGEFISNSPNFIVASYSTSFSIHYGFAQVLVQIFRDYENIKYLMIIII